MARLRIQEVASERGINQSRLQIKSGLTPPMLNRYWHNNTRTVSLEALTKLAKALGVKPADLIADDEDVLENVA